MGSLQAKLEAANRQPELQASVQIIQNNLQKLKQFVRRMDSKGEVGWQLAARDFAYDLAWIYEGNERIAWKYFASLPQNHLKLLNVVQKDSEW